MNTEHSSHELVLPQDIREKHGLLLPLSSKKRLSETLHHDNISTYTQQWCDMESTQWET